MDREKSSLFLGLGLLFFGIAILMAVLASVVGLAANPGPFLARQTGGGEATPPQAFFAWTSQNLTVTFRDLSSSGTAAITSYEWDFGDGATAGDRDPTHTYASNGSYFVRLTVRDADGLAAVAGAQVDVQPSGMNQGTAQVNPNFDFNFGDILMPVAVAMLTFGMWVVGFLVGGSLVKAGWNLIRPRPETIRIKFKPKMLEAGATAEIVPPAAPPPPTAMGGAAMPPPPEP